jgi:hypothetical protein
MNSRRPRKPPEKMRLRPKSRSNPGSNVFRLSPRRPSYRYHHPPGQRQSWMI